MIIVLDSNVVVSGILQPLGKPAMILRLVGAGRLQCAYDLRIMTEYREVLTRPKFGFSENQVKAFLTPMEEEGIPVVAGPLSVEIPDPDDQPFLEVALAAKAEALITGNKKHFPRGNYGGVKIVSPLEFLERYGPRLESC